MNFWLSTVGSTIVCVHSTIPPTEEQWSGVVAALKTTGEKIGFAAVRILVFTDGGAPNSAQRERLNDLLSGCSVRAAIISSNSIVRGVVTAFGWFNPQFKSFTPNRVRDGLAHIGFTEIAKLRSQLRPIAASVETVRNSFLTLDQPDDKAALS